MKKGTQKRFNASTIAALLLVTVLFLTTACAQKEETTEEAKNSTEKVVETKVEEIAETTTPETVTTPETTAESDITAEPETVVPQSVWEWSNTLERTEPQMTIWNDTLKEGIVLENGQKYVLREGDLLVICTKEKRTDIVIGSGVSSEDFKSLSSDTYIQFEFKKVFLEETLFEANITVAGVEYPFSVTLISENATADTNASAPTVDVLGIDWAHSLDNDEPTLLVWNDEIGTKEMIENGGQYKMQNGDTLAVCYPAGYMVHNVEPSDFVEEIIPVSESVVMFKCKLLDESQNINLEMGVFDGKDLNSSIPLSYTITTP